MADLNFNAREVEPASTFEPLLAGKYVAAITGSEMKQNKAGTGSYLELAFTVLEGEYKGRQLWARLNLHNPNATAVKIARSELSAICHAVHVLEPRDSVELHNLPLLITVKCKKRQDNGEIVNEVKGYESKAAPPQAPQTPANTTAPWAR
ncbi:MAG: DUF669 domain-containing protein [Sedimentisphaerales bacterium]|nr:DUF669 domain-containing protein [Sedimentisphaerales bacterium]